MSRIVFLDTETTGLDPDHEQVFEIAGIEQDGTEHVYRVEPLGIVVAHMHPKAAEVNRYHERTAAEGWEWDDLHAVLDALTDLLDGAHICGAVPNFDARFLTALYRDECRNPPAWHYHLIDIEAMAVGYLHGMSRFVDAAEDNLRLLGGRPWKSDDLSLACGVEPPGDDERHTALGDARWCKRLYEAITGGAA